DVLDGVEAHTPDPTFGNKNAPEYWRNKGLQKGHRWIAIAGTDCHVHSDKAYDGDTACSKSIHGLVDTTNFDAPYMWVRPMTSTAYEFDNAPPLIVAAMREGRLSIVQDKNPAAIVDLAIDANDDGYLDYVSGQ